MFRSTRFGTWGPVVLACLAVTVALRAAELKLGSSRAVRTQDESGAVRVDLAAFPTFKVAPGTEIRQAYPEGESQPVTAGAEDEKLVYSNTLGTVAASLVNGAFISDDMTMNIIAGCALKEFRFRVIGKADPFAFQSGNFRVDWQLYSQCPGAAPNSTTIPIANTGGFRAFSEAVDGLGFDSKIQEIIVTVPDGVALPPTVWLGVKANRLNVGVIIGAPALVGFSSDRLDFPGFACNAFLGGFPNSPHASFWAQIKADSTCVDSHPGYHNTSPGRGGFSEGTNKCMADDLHLADTDCKMVALEVNVKGQGLYKFDVRRDAGGLPGALIPGTARTRSVPGTAVGAQVVRFNYDPPITLGPANGGGQRVWVTFQGNNPGAGWILTRKDADIGDTAQTYGRSITGAGCDVVNDWEVVNPADNTAHGGFDVTIYCQALATPGQCCDMYLTDDGQCLPAESRVCQGGPSDGQPCTISDDCGFGICTGTRCVGGQFDGNSCVGEVDCKGDPQCRYVPLMNCSFPPRNQNLKPRWQEGAPCRRCLLGTNDGEPCETDADCPNGTCAPNILPGQRPCGVAACCPPDESGCVFLTEKQCEKLTPAYEPQTRSWQLGRYCSQDGQRCARNACLGKPGNCTIPRPQVCEGGAKVGQNCFQDSLCRSSCSTLKCFGGPRNGQTCSSNLNCVGPNPGPGDDGTCLVTCTGGLHPGLLCLNDEICNDDGRCQQINEEGLSVCVGGQSAGQECRSSAQCVGGTCSVKACVGGIHNGIACEEPRDCRGATCKQEPGCSNPFCCTAVCDWEADNIGTTFCCDFHWDAECARIANQEIEEDCEIAPDNDTCATEDRTGGARVVPFPGDDEIAMNNASNTDSSEPGFCCHGGFAPRCVGGPFDGFLCNDTTECECAPDAPGCTSGFCPEKAPLPGERGYTSIWYRFAIPAGPQPVNVEVTTCNSIAVDANDSLLQVYALSNPDVGICDNLGRCSDTGAACLLTEEAPCDASAICEPVTQACSLSGQDCPHEGSDCLFNLTLACGTLVNLGCNDDAPNGCPGHDDRPGNSKLCLPQLAPGQTYIVQLASKTLESNTSYQVDIKPVGSCPAATVANDTCARATPVGDGAHNFDFTNATFDCPAPECAPASQNDLWWKFTPTVTGKATIETCGGTIATTADTELSVYEGCNCPTSTTPRSPLACDSFAGGQCQDGSRVMIDVKAGNCYLVRVGDRLGQRGVTVENGNLRTGKVTITTAPLDCNNNGHADTCDLSCAAAGCAAVPGCGTHSDCNDNDIPDECEVDPGCCPSGPVIFHDPSDGVVDARNPVDPVSGNPAGITQIHVTAPAGAGPQCWHLCETATDGSPNDMTVIGALGEYTITFDRPITPNACTTITFLAGDGARPQGKFVSHPGNVNGDVTATSDDVQRLIDTLNAGGVSPPNAPWGLLSSDMDHSGATAGPDLIELVNILIGAGSRPDPGTNNTALPTCAACPPPP